MITRSGIRERFVCRLISGTLYATFARNKGNPSERASRIATSRDSKQQFSLSLSLSRPLPSLIYSSPHAPRGVSKMRDVRRAPAKGLCEIKWNPRAPLVPSPTMLRHLKEVFREHKVFCIRVRENLRGGGEEDGFIGDTFVGPALPSLKQSPL